MDEENKTHTFSPFEFDSPIIINFHLPMHWCGGVSNSKGDLGLMEIVKYIERVKETVKNVFGKMKLCLLVFVIERDTIVFIGFIIINIFSFKIEIQCNNY